MRQNQMVKAGPVLFFKTFIPLAVFLLVVLIASPAMNVPLAEAAVFTVDSTNDTVDANPGDGVCADADANCTLRAAIMEANALAGADEILVPAETYTLTTPGGNENAAATGDLDITGFLTLTGDGAGSTIVDAGDLDRVFEVLAGGVVTIEDMTIQNGNSNLDGGGIVNRSQLTLMNVSVDSNMAPRNGGGIWNGGTVDIQASFISNNNADGTGGGIHSPGTLIVQNGSTVEENRSNSSGGGLWSNGSLTINDTTVSNNTSGANGGGVFNGGGGTTINNGAISGNSAVTGGGIFNTGTLILNNPTVNGNNIASNDGGGIWNGGTMSLTGGVISSNLATADGGGVFDGNALAITGTTISNNMSLSGRGGGIHREFPNGNMTLTDARVSGNSAFQGGGIWNTGTRAFTVVNSAITDNRATNGSGGGVLTTGGNMEISDTAIMRNSATVSGGGIWGQFGTLTISRSTIAENVSNGTGGGISSNGDGLSIINSTISGNTATSHGGGLHRASGVNLPSLTFVTVAANSTTVGNGGGITGGVNLRSTIVANNSPGGNCSGNMLTNGYNLDSDDTCSLTDRTDLPNTDPKLGPLQDNGGPTLTHAPLSSSPAIDHVPPTDCTDLDGNPVMTDQRGVARPRGPGCDIGAYETQSVPPPSLEGEPSFTLHQDQLDGATGFKVDITRVFDPSTGNDVAVSLGAFQAQLTYDGSCVNLLDVRDGDIPITAVNIDDNAGIVAFNGTAPAGVPWPTDLGHVLTRLVGGATQQCQVELEITSLSDVNGNPIFVPTVLNHPVQRGDVRADGVVNIADALFTAQYLVGQRSACTATVDTTCLHSVNAASVRQDGPFDQKTIADVLFTAQYLAGMREEFFSLVP